MKDIRFVISLLISYLLTTAALFSQDVLDELPVTEPGTVRLEPTPFPKDYRPAFGCARPFRLREKVPDHIVPKNLPPGKEGPPGKKGMRFGRLKIPPEADLMFALTNAMPGPPELYLDLNRSGSFLDDGPPFVGRRTEDEGNTILFFEDLPLESPPQRQDGQTLRSRWPQTGRKTFHSPRRGTLRFVYSSEEEGPKGGCFYTRTWMAGPVEDMESVYRLFLLDLDGDGRFTRRDRWSLAVEGGENPPRSPAFFPRLDQPLLIREGPTLAMTGFRLISFNEAGDRARITPITHLAPPTDAENEASPIDSVPRPPALHPLSWNQDPVAAAARALKGERRLLVLVTTPGCPLCKAYLDDVWADGEVTELAAGFIPVHIRAHPGDAAAESLDLPGFPFLAVLSPSAKVLRRYPGYLTPVELTRVLKEWLD